MNFEKDIFNKVPDGEMPSKINDMLIKGEISSINELDDVGNTLYSVAKHLNYQNTIMFLYTKGGTSPVKYKETPQANPDKVSLIQELIEKEEMGQDVSELEKELLDTPSNEEEKTLEDEEIIEPEIKENDWMDDILEEQEAKKSKKQKKPKKKGDKSNILKEKTEGAINYIKTKRERIKDIHSRILNDPSVKRKINK